MADKRTIIAQLNMPFYPSTRLWVDSDPLILATGIDREAYVGALRTELSSTLPDYSDDCSLMAVWVGGLPWQGGMDCGGISLHMADDKLGALLRELRLSVISVPVDDQPLEITLTAHPGMVAATALDVCRRGHARRIWVDYATSNPVEATRLGRFIGPEAMEVTRTVLGPYLQAGTIELGMGLLAGIAGQTEHSAQASVEAAVRYGATWIGVELFRGSQNVAAIPDPARANELLASMYAKLVSEGFEEYTPGQWALPGHESRYLKAYRQGCERLGFGLGAESAIDGLGSCNTADLRVYVHNPDYPAYTIARTWQLPQ